MADIGKRLNVPDKMQGAAFRASCSEMVGNRVCVRTIEWFLCVLRT